MTKARKEIDLDARAWLEALPAEQRIWFDRDMRLRGRASELARKLDRDEESLYKTLLNFRRSASERLAIGLRHGRLRTLARRA